MTATPAQAVATQVTQRMQPVGGVPVHAVAAVISLLYAGRVARAPVTALVAATGRGRVPRPDGADPDRRCGDRRLRRDPGCGLEPCGPNRRCQWQIADARLAVPPVAGQQRRADGVTDLPELRYGRGGVHTDPDRRLAAHGTACGAPQRVRRTGERRLRHEPAQHRPAVAVARAALVSPPPRATVAAGASAGR
jgi:hypothetical protein